MYVGPCLQRGGAWLGTVPDEGGVLRADEHKQAHAHQLLRRQQDVLVVPGDVLLQLGGPHLLVGGAERDGTMRGPSMSRIGTWWGIKVAVNMSRSSSDICSKECVFVLPRLMSDDS